jgi:hypothetical protein
VITEKNKYLCITFTVKNKYLNKYQVFKFRALAQEDANGYRQGFLMGLCTFAKLSCVYQFLPQGVQSGASRRGNKYLWSTHCGLNTLYRKPHWLASKELLLPVF